MFWGRGVAFGGQCYHTRGLLARAQHEGTAPLISAQRERPELTAAHQPPRSAPAFQPRLLWSRGQITTHTLPRCSWSCIRAHRQHICSGSSKGGGEGIPASKRSRRLQLINCHRSMQSALLRCLARTGAFELGLKNAIGCAIRYLLFCTGRCNLRVFY